MLRPNRGQKGKGSERQRPEEGSQRKDMFYIRSPDEEGDDSERKETRKAFIYYEAREGKHIKIQNFPLTTSLLPPLEKKSLMQVQIR